MQILILLRKYEDGFANMQIMVPKTELVLYNKNDLYAGMQKIREVLWVKSHIHTKEDLFTWLFSYTEYENICMEYYKTYKAFMPDFIREEKLKQLDLDVIDTMHPYIKDSYSYKGVDSSFPCHENRNYDSQNFIDDDEAFSVLKHPRYHNCTIHSHTFFEFIFVFHGTCRNIIFKEKNQELILSKNDVILIPPNILHKIIVDDDSIVLNILVRLEWMRDYILQNLPIKHRISQQISEMVIHKRFHSTIVFRQACLNMVRNALYDMILEYCSNTVYRNELISLAFCKFLLLLMSYSDIDTIYADCSTKLSQLVPSVVSYINQNYAIVKCRDIADHFHFTQSHLNQTFQQIMGISLHKYLFSVKLKEACKLLANTALPVNEVADLVGYKDSAGFNRAFKQEYGMTPLQYRKQNQIL